MAALVAMQNICKSFGSVRALDGAYLEICQGLTTAIVGGNGSGKSTLIKILSGNLPPDSGSIVIDGHSYAKLSVRQSLDLGIRTVYQDLSLDDCKNSAENVFLGAELTRGPFLAKKAMMQATDLLLKSLNVQIDDLGVTAGQLSGGQRQGLAIARALKDPCRLLLLDEPTAAMGVRESLSAMELLQGFKAQGMTQVIVSHNLFMVYDLADRIFVMRSGRCVTDVMTAETTLPELQKLILAKEQEAQ